MKKQTWYVKNDHKSEKHDNDISKQIADLTKNFNDYVLNTTNINKKLVEQVQQQTVLIEQVYRHTKLIHTVSLNVNKMKNTIERQHNEIQKLKTNNNMTGINNTAEINNTSVPLMFLTQLLKKSAINAKDTITPLIPDTTRSIYKTIDTTQYDNFVELSFNNLDDISNCGQAFIDMIEKHNQAIKVPQTDDKNDTKFLDNILTNNIFLPSEGIHTNYNMLDVVCIDTTHHNSIEQNEKLSLCPPTIKNTFAQTVKPNNVPQKININDNVLLDENNLYNFMGKKYSINPKKIMNLVKPIKLLNSMIGMTEVKKSILGFISNFLHINKNNGMLNTAIYGKPGIGKTDLGKIICMIYTALELVPTNKFKLVKASDLIGQYVGHTRQKTKDVLNEADGGVLFIDEAYSLTSGSTEKASFGKECIDTINQELSENRNNLVIIIAGYEEDINNGFFKINQGLERRFPFRYILKDYNKNDMKNILLRMLRLNNNIYLYENKNDEEETITEEYLISIFDDMKYFENSGGDIENLITHIGIANSFRTFGKLPSHKNIYTKTDFKNGFKMFKKHKLNVNNKDIWNNIYI